ncbi:hypothetical protein FJTKL_11694 [Diaporthe vaccinii]|uniref:SGNH hydrolase-type esterase domain-containing protein n=1 Tax=Diaporthe vaccinii TaxID=105482 RepID=A0ABR4EFM3_9PEZI
MRLLRLMPLGGSVTFRSGSSHANGYREKLRQLLIENGYTVQMVGSRRSGTLSNNHNEGWRGFRIDQIHNKAEKSIPLLRPSLVTINAGSNDCIQRFKIDYIEKRMDSLLEMTWHASPRSTILLSTLLANSDTSVEAKILETNAQYHGVHPNDLGYQKMALLWYEGIQDCASRGLIDEPAWEV